MKLSTLIGILVLATAAAFVTPAFAKVYTDIAIVSTAGSDANNCVWKTPFALPVPPACRTGTHAATLLKGPGSALEFMSGTYSEHVVINANKVSWPSDGASLTVGKFTGATVLFDGGGFAVTGDGFVDIRGIKIINGPGDCITYHGTSSADLLQGRIENEDIYGCAGHIVSLVNTNAVEVGYNFFSDSGKGQSELFLSNSPNYNIHETSLQMLVGKTPQLGASILNSPTGLFDIHADTFVGPTALYAVNSPHISTIILDKAPYTANICPATDIVTDMFVANWTVKACVQTGGPCAERADDGNRNSIDFR